MITHISTDDDCKTALCLRRVTFLEDVFYYQAEYIPQMSADIQATITCAECVHEVERRKAEAGPMDAAPKAELTDEAREWLVAFAAGSAKSG